MIADVFIDGKNRLDVSNTLALLLGAIVLRALLGWAADVAAAHAAAGVKHRLEQVFSHLVKRGPIAVDGERTGELVSSLTEGIEALDAYVARYLPQLALAAPIPSRWRCSC